MKKIIPILVAVLAVFSLIAVVFSHYQPQEEKDCIWWGETYEDDLSFFSTYFTQENVLHNDLRGSCHPVSIVLINGELGFVNGKFFGENSIILCENRTGVGVCLQTDEGMVNLDDEKLQLKVKLIRDELKKEVEDYE